MGRASAKIASNVQPHLRPGEEVRAAFAGQTSIRFTAGDRYRTIVVTDQRVLVFDSGTFKQTRCGDLLAELPPGVDLGEPSGLWHRVVLTGETLHVNRRYFDQVRAGSTTRS